MSIFLVFGVIAGLFCHSTRASALREAIYWRSGEFIARLVRVMIASGLAKFMRAITEKPASSAPNPNLWRRFAVMVGMSQANARATQIMKTDV